MFRASPLPCIMVRVGVSDCTYENPGVGIVAHYDLKGLWIYMIGITMIWNDHDGANRALAMLASSATSCKVDCTAYKTDVTFVCKEMSMRHGRSGRTASAGRGRRPPMPASAFLLALLQPLPCKTNQIEGKYLVDSVERSNRVLLQR